MRFETPAGRQGQADFGRFVLPWGARYALVVVLSYSRLLWLRFYRTQTMAVLTDGLESAFERFGGVPEELLFDQMRAVVLSDDRGSGGELTLNTEFLRFAAHWGFRARSCRPYRARTKGKVERPIRYIRESFFYGRQFANDADLNEQAERWLERTANVRRHGTTGERPVDRFEPPSASPLCPSDLMKGNTSSRTVSNICSGAASLKRDQRRLSCLAVKIGSPIGLPVRAALRSFRVCSSSSRLMKSRSGELLDDRERDSRCRQTTSCSRCCPPWI